MLYALFFFSIRLKNTNFAFIFFRSFAPDILRVRCFLMERFSHFDKTPETSGRVTWANLSRHIPRPLSESPLARPTFVRFNSGVRLFDFANLGKLWLCPDDFSRGVYPPSFVCSTYFSSRGNTMLRFASSRLRCSILFVGHNILENTCR